LFLLPPPPPPICICRWQLREARGKEESLSIDLDGAIFNNRSPPKYENFFVES